MDHNRGKPVATSVPSITIKFHANAEQLEELFTLSDEELPTATTSDVTTTITTTTTASNESDKSPLKLFPRFVKRSTSIDITPVTKQQSDNSSPPSDPWRFFSDIKGKITKSVEEKITEIKARNCDENSPSKQQQLKDTSSSLSDSEEISESSISKTCGLLSTTEGVEMSSDDDLNHDDNSDGKSAKKSKNLRQRFKLFKASLKSNKQNNTNNQNVTINTLTTLYNINTDRIEPALVEDDSKHDADVDDIEDAIEAIEDEYDKKLITTINKHYDNIEIVDDHLIKINEIHGNDLNKFDNRTVFAPVGFVDMRTPNKQTVKKTKRFYINFILFLIVIIIYSILYFYSTYWTGVLFGIITTQLFVTIKSFLYSEEKQIIQQPEQTLKNIVEIEAVEEFQPLKKYEGWVNELPETYDPLTYHINKTQSVYLRLQGNLLRMSHTHVKVPKRALWNESKIKPTFSHHRIYNLLNAKVQLLPKGLARKRHWSKKYPICIVLTTAVEQIHVETDPVHHHHKHEDIDESHLLKSHLKTVHINQQFSKLAADEDNHTEYSRASTPSSLDPTEQLLKKYDLDHDDDDAASEAWSTIDECPETKLYIFGRTDREKEEWFRRLQLATQPQQQHTADSSDYKNNEINYLKFMQYFDKNLQLKHESDKTKHHSPIKDNTTVNKLLEERCLNNIFWINTLMGRIMFDCLYNNVHFTQKVKERIQKKLSAIKLPYFIEEIIITELSLGHTPPIIHNAKKPVINERGLWIDLDITYEGLIVLILHTKLNLMKLKHPPSHEKTNADEKLAMFNSDVDDSAESSSDDSLTHFTTEQQHQLLDNTIANTTTGVSSSNSKKFIRIVDKIAESKIFQAAAENRLIKRAMENVSNTDLGLRCELKQLNGTLVLNIPTPPSDRLWMGFQPLPQILMKAHPMVGETNITFMRITSWIEKKLLQEFQKVLVLPNMEDLTIPVMTPRVID